MSYNDVYAASDGRDPRPDGPAGDGQRAAAGDESPPGRGAAGSFLLCPHTVLFSFPFLSFLVT